MKTLDDIRDAVSGELDRADLEDAQLDRFIQSAQQRLTRLIRIPAMEARFEFTSQEGCGQIELPTDFLELIDIFVEGPRELTYALQRLALRQLVELPTQSSPQAYARCSNDIVLRGNLRPSQKAIFHYYAKPPALLAPQDTNALSQTCPDLLVYAALKYAGGWFQHPQTQAWEDIFQGLLAEIQKQNYDFENSGGPAAVQPLYV